MYRTLMTGTLIVLFMILLVRYSTAGSIFEQSCDIGNCPLKGSVKYDKASGTYTLVGSGRTMHEENDEYFTTCRKVVGDFSLSTRVAFTGKRINPQCAMGIIILESLESDARHIDLCVHGSGLTEYEWRDQKGATTQEIQVSHQMPDYIKIERRGNKIILKTAYGKGPEEIIGVKEINLPDTAFVGLFVCSQDANALDTVAFSNIKFKKL